MSNISMPSATLSFRLTIKGKLIGLSLILLFFLVGTGFFLRNFIVEGDKSRTYQVERQALVEQTIIISKNFGDLKYWLTDLEVSWLVESEENAQISYEKLQQNLILFKDMYPIEVAKIRSHAQTFFEKSINAVDAYVDGNRVLGNSLAAEARSEIHAVDLVMNSIIKDENDKVLFSRSSASAQEKQALIIYVIIVAMVVVMIALVTYFIIRSITQPLAHMTKAMSNLANVELHSENPALKRHDEIGDLARSFLRMAEDLEKSEKANAMMYVELEQRISDRTQVLEFTKKRAEAANVAKSEFLATMSHEIRTPMNVVLGMASVLLRSNLSPDHRWQIGVIRESGQAMLLLLNDILDLSKIEAGRLELEMLDFDLQDLLETIEALWESRLAGKGLDFTINIEKCVVPILRSDPARIRQILFNLISNAAKFTDSGGVTITVTQHFMDDEGLETLFKVTDTGIGIAPEVQPHILSKFTQADSSTTRKYGGSGLGLAICEQLSILLGGRIGLESEPGEGSTFWFTVQCKPGDENAINTDLFGHDTDLQRPEVPIGPLRILVAEDNVGNQVLIRTLLECEGHEFDIVNDGIEAVSAVKRVPYDLVLMDIQMPEMDGVTATRKIRDLPGKIGSLPIIALTANAMKSDREKYLAAGMSDYVAKPIDPNEFLAVISRWGTEMKPAAVSKDRISKKTKSTTESPVLNQEVLDLLCEKIGDERMYDLIDQCAEQLTNNINRIIEKGKGTDLKAIQREAHDLKGTSGSFGAARLQKIADALDRACKEGNESIAKKLTLEIGLVGLEACNALRDKYGLTSPEPKDFLPSEQFAAPLPRKVH
ncbi:MAG: response regulator [Sneathiella sp.]|nr:response regulator [Sneathiella sp.]